MSGSKYYLAGPMSGIPQFNFPAFFAAAAELRERGFDIVSPAEIDDKEDHGAALKSPDGDMRGSEKTWGDFLSRDVKLIADQVDGIIFLQPEWIKSRGAKLEAFTGLLSGKKFANYVRGVGIEHLDPEFVREALRKNMP